jgi:hypothetical protein
VTARAYTHLKLKTPPRQSVPQADLFESDKGDA